MQIAKSPKLQTPQERIAQLIALRGQAPTIPSPMPAPMMRPDLSGVPLPQPPASPVLPSPVVQDPRAERIEQLKAVLDTRINPRAEPWWASGLRGIARGGGAGDPTKASALVMEGEQQDAQRRQQDIQNRVAQLATIQGDLERDRRNQRDEQQDREATEYRRQTLANDAARIRVEQDRMSKTEFKPRPLTVVMKDGSKARVNYDEASGRYFDLNDQDVSASVVDEHKDTRDPRGFQERQAELVEAAYAERLKKPVEDLTATERVQAQRWYASMTPAQQTEFDKRLDLYRRDPTTYNSLYGRGEDALTPAQITAVVQRMITAARDPLTGKVDPGIYEQQRQTLSRTLGVELPKFGEAQSQPPMTPKPPKPEDDMSGIHALPRRMSIGEVIMGADNQQYQITGFDAEGQPVGIPIPRRNK